MPASQVCLGLISTHHLMRTVDMWSVAIKGRQVYKIGVGGLPVAYLSHAFVVTFAW